MTRERPAAASLAWHVALHLSSVPVSSLIHSNEASPPAAPAATRHRAGFARSRRKGLCPGLLRQWAFLLASCPRPRLGLAEPSVPCPSLGGHRGGGLPEHETHWHTRFSSLEGRGWWPHGSVCKRQATANSREGVSCTCCPHTRPAAPSWAPGCRCGGGSRGEPSPTRAGRRGGGCAKCLSRGVF